MRAVDSAKFPLLAPFEDHGMNPWFPPWPQHQALTDDMGTVGNDQKHYRRAIAKAGLPE
jgi:hypothetical protein